MIPGEVIPLEGEIALNEDRKSTTLMAVSYTHLRAHETLR